MIKHKNKRLLRQQNLLKLKTSKNRDDRFDRQAGTGQNGTLDYRTDRSLDGMGMKEDRDVCLWTEQCLSWFIFYLSKRICFSVHFLKWTDKRIISNVPLAAPLTCIVPQMSILDSLICTCLWGTCLGNILSLSNASLMISKFICCLGQTELIHLNHSICLNHMKKWSK